MAAIAGLCIASVALALGPAYAVQAQEKPAPVEITVLGVGDVLVHRQIIDQAKSDARDGARVDFRPMLEGIAPLVEMSDLAVCHMEYPMGSPGGPWSAWPDLPNAPPQLAKAMAWFGFDACSTASNHSLDQGFDGVVSTIDAIERAGMVAFGTARTEEESLDPRIIEVKGVAIALMSYSYGFNGIPLPSGREWCCNRISPERIIRDARHARKAGARIVVVSLHHGVEGQVTPTQEQRSVVQALADSGEVDLVLGHHAHVIQPVDKVNGMWVAYGHGNLLSAQSRKDPRSGDGLLTMFTFVEQEDGSFEVERAVGYAIRNADYPFRLHPVPDRASAEATDKGTWKRTKDAVMRLGAHEKGFRLLRLGG